MAEPHSYLPTLRQEQLEGRLTEAGLLAVGSVSFPQKLGEEDQGQRSEKGNDLKEDTGTVKPSPSWPSPPVAVLRSGSESPQDASP